MSSIKKNLSLQTAYRVLSVCMPLITAPYLARRLGAEQLGVFSFTTSVVAYFTLAAMLGTLNYGTRTIASVKGDRVRRDEAFSAIFLFQLAMTLAALAAYLVYLVFFCTSNRTIAWLQGIALLSCLLDINWLFFGVEDFQITVTRSMVIKILSVVLILLLVKQQSDLWKYTLIMLGATFLSNAILFLYLPRYATLRKVSLAQIKAHIRPNLVLFVPLLAMTVYHTMDKTMLGLLSTYEQSGFYYNSDKVVQIPLVIINGVGTVMLPRMSALLAEGRQAEADRLFMTTMEGIAVTGVALACGIAAVAKEFVPFFFGAGYDPCILITIVFTPILLIKGFSSIARTQYLIPMKMERDFTVSVVGGAVVNLVLNLLLIPRHGALGAAVATVIAELAACVLQFVSLRGRALGIGRLLLKTAQYAVIGLAMVGVVRLAALAPVGIVWKLALEILVGAGFFALCCAAYWTKTKNPMFDLFCRPILRRLRPR